VTSNLDLKTKQAEHCQGDSGSPTTNPVAPKAFVLKILTLKPLALKILRTTFCKCRASHGFQEVSGRGVSTEFVVVPKTERRRIGAISRHSGKYLSLFSTGRSLPAVLVLLLIFVAL
jgi:hypothetical protein